MESTVNSPPELCFPSYTSTISWDILPLIPLMLPYEQLLEASHGLEFILYKFSPPSLVSNPQLFMTVLQSSICFLKFSPISPFCVFFVPVVDMCTCVFGNLGSGLSAHAREGYPVLYFNTLPCSHEIVFQ